MSFIHTSTVSYFYGYRAPPSTRGMQSRCPGVLSSVNPFCISRYEIQSRSRWITGLCALFRESDPQTSQAATLNFLYDCLHDCVAWRQTGDYLVCGSIPCGCKHFGLSLYVGKVSGFLVFDFSYSVDCARLELFCRHNFSALI